MSSSAPAAPSSPKRPRLATLASLAALPIRLEPAAACRVDQMFGDGSYVPVGGGVMGAGGDDGDGAGGEEWMMRQASRGATSFVSRALAGQAEADPGRSNRGEANGKDEDAAGKDADADAGWAGRVVESVDGALAELGRAISVIEALRGGDGDGGRGGGEALLELERYGGRQEEPAGRRQTGGGVALMGKRRTLEANASFLDDRVRGLRKWCVADAEFARAVVRVRGMCGGLRRVGGVPLVDVGEGDFVALERGVEGVAEAVEGKARKTAAVRLRVGGDVALSYGVCDVGGAAGVAEDFRVGEGERLARKVGEEADGGGVGGVVRRVRLARMAAFREQTFARIAREAAEGERTVELTSNCVSVECGPGQVLRVQRTMRGVEEGRSDAAGGDDGDDAGLLSIVAATRCLQLSVHSGGTGGAGRVLDALELVAVGVNTQRALEKVLDGAALQLRVRVNWSRGEAVQREASARVWADAADGDGRSRLLATFDPLSDGNNAGRRYWNGHVRVTPAFGVVIAAPDDPFARCRSGAHGIHMQSSSLQSQPVAGLDDVPRAYVCPIESGEIESVLTLLMCVRLLDELEAAARTCDAAVLDVDRHCFGVVVLAPKTARTLRAKVWPKGLQAGWEKPEVTVWLNDEHVDGFSTDENGHLAAWRRLIAKISGGEGGDRAGGNAGGVDAAVDGGVGVGGEVALAAGGATPMASEGHLKGNGWAHAGDEVVATRVV